MKGKTIKDAKQILPAVTSRRIQSNAEVQEFALISGFAFEN